jgi:hypothetical protein
MRRLRDPVHGLIVFGDNKRDEIAWSLIDTPEFQRLRRIRQLGVSEFTFPGATHSRFAHSIGVFHVARALTEVVDHLTGDAYDKARANVSVFAALLHDIGHGPFSHAFESVQQARNVKKKHESWSAEIILNPAGNIRRLLESFRIGTAEQVASLIGSENPTDEYHAIVSSAFDADRLDYLRRDRLMTGSGAGAIDFDWLKNNIQLAEVSLAADDEENGPKFTTFCLDLKALQAAESFLLARYHLSEQVYLHKTTRGVETLLRVLLSQVANACSDLAAVNMMGLDARDPIVRFFAPDGENVANYLALDDFSVWTSISCIARGSDPSASELARRLLERRLLKSFDVNSEFPVEPGEKLEETERRRQAKIAEIEGRIGAELEKSVFKDAPKLNVYGEFGGDEAKKHKKLRVRLKDGAIREIHQLSPTINTLMGHRMIVRYYGAPESIARLRG